MTLSEIDQANAEFWNELCGSGFAQSLGIKDHSEESLRRFDAGYLDFYPYLLDHVKTGEMTGKKVLEIGLGYGTLGQKIAEAGAEYAGLDIAEGPVRMMSHRLRMHGLGGQVFRGSMLSCPFPSESLDFVVSIGCFHHTGDIERCIAETYRVLKPGGKAFLMVYNQFSYRQWMRWPLQTFLAFLNDFASLQAENRVTSAERGAYDTNTLGESAPETVFISLRKLKSLFKKFSRTVFQKENCDDFYFLGALIGSRKNLLSTLGRFWGTDIYIEAQK